MATIKVKLRPSSVVGRAGTIYYQVTHRRATQQITTNIRLQPDEWDAIGEQVVVSVADKSIIQNRIDSDIALLKRIVKGLGKNWSPFILSDIINIYKLSENSVLILDLCVCRLSKWGTQIVLDKNFLNIIKSLYFVV